MLEKDNIIVKWSLVTSIFWALYFALGIYLVLC